MKLENGLVLATMILGTCAFSSAVLAADLENHDDVAYDVKIHDGATTRTSISSNSTRISVRSSCTIEVVGIGEIAVDSSVEVWVADSAASMTQPQLAKFCH